MLNLVRHFWVLTLSAILLPISALAETSTKEFVRQQAGKAGFMADVEKIDFIASEVFRFQMLGVMRMTHIDWRFEEDDFLRDHQQTYSYKIRGSAEDIGYETVQLDRSINRNRSVDHDQKEVATDLLSLLKDLATRSTQLATLYDEGDIHKAGDYFYSEIYPRYLSIRRGVYTLSVELRKAVNLDALKFKP